MNDTLARGLSMLNLQSYPQAVEKLMDFCGMLLEKNKVMNLTGAKDETEVVEKHFLDCAAAFAPLDLSGKRVIDVGCGAGFPGMPLALLYPQGQFTLLDSLGERIAFLQECIDALPVSNAVAVHARAEEYAAQHREAYDVVTSRAVANLSMLSELCLPFVRVGGVFAAMKSTGSDDEIAQAAYAIRVLGGTLETVRDYEIPLTGVQQRLVLIRKTAPTPAKYPRRFSKISAAPLAAR